MLQFGVNGGTEDLAKKHWKLDYLVKLMSEILVNSDFQCAPIVATNEFSHYYRLNALVSSS